MKYPKPGTKLRRQRNGVRETRTVIDRTCGGSVIYVVGSTRGTQAPSSKGFV